MNLLPQKLACQTWSQIVNLLEQVLPIPSYGGNVCTCQCKLKETPTLNADPCTHKLTSPSQLNTHVIHVQKVILQGNKTLLIRPKIQYYGLIVAKQHKYQKISEIHYVSSYYLIEVQVDMVKHVYEQKYSGNLHKDHFSKYVQDARMRLYVLNLTWQFRMIPQIHKKSVT